MFRVKNKNIYMTENDFGVKLPIKFVLGNVLETDTIKFIIYKEKSEDEKEIILTKDFSALDNVFEFVLTKEESSLLERGVYKYGVKQYREESLVDTISVDRSFYIEEGIKEV